MGHYNRQAWLFYRDGFLPDHLRTVMEEHLQTCEACLDIYLSTFQPEDEKEAAKLLSPGFRAGLRRRLAPLAPRTAPLRTAKVIQYYALAAAITLLLLAGGWFDVLSQVAPRSLTRAESLTPTVQLEAASGWSEKLLDQVSIAIRELMTNDRREANHGQE